MNTSDNIELRSEKIRNIIGQIPPNLIRFGISLIFIVFTIVSIGTYFFEYDKTLKVIAKLSMHKDSIAVQLDIPLYQKEMIRTGQRVFLNFDKIPNMYGQRIIIHLPNIIGLVHVSNKGGYYSPVFYMSQSTLHSNNFDYKIDGPLTVDAEILIGRIRFSDQLIDPIKALFKHWGK
jgi:hypothetical protein